MATIAALLVAVLAAVPAVLSAHPGVIAVLVRKALTIIAALVLLKTPFAEVKTAYAYALAVRLASLASSANASGTRGVPVRASVVVPEVSLGATSACDGSRVSGISKAYTGQLQPKSAIHELPAAPDVTTADAV